MSKLEPCIKLNLALEFMCVSWFWLWRSHQSLVYVLQHYPRFELATNWDSLCLTGRQISGGAKSQISWWISICIFHFGYIHFLQFRFQISSFFSEESPFSSLISDKHLSSQLLISDILHWSQCASLPRVNSVTRLSKNIRRRWVIWDKSIYIVTNFSKKCLLSSWVSTDITDFRS